MAPSSILRIGKPSAPEAANTAEKRLVRIVLRARQMQGQSHHAEVLCRGQQNLHPASMYFAVFAVLPGRAHIGEGAFDAIRKIGLCSRLGLRCLPLRRDEITGALDFG